MKNSNCKKIFVALSLLLVCASLTAQNNPLEDILFGTTVNDVPAGPIDGFLGIALAVGAYFGVRKLRKKDQ